MNESEVNTPAPGDISQQISALQRQLFTLLLALIVVSGSLVTFLCYQSHIAGKEINAMSPQAIPVIQAFNADHVAMDKFINQLVAYAGRHPDFQPILKKYGIVPSPRK